MDGVLQIKLARCTSKSNRYLQPSRRKWRARGPGTVLPLMLRFASCLPACQIRSIRCNNLKREGAHGWIASRKLIEKGNRTPAYHGNVFPSYEEYEHTEGRAASPNPSGTIRQRWIRWPRIQSSWIRESTPADANTQD